MILLQGWVGLFVKYDHIMERQRNNHNRKCKVEREKTRRFFCLDDDGLRENPPCMPEASVQSSLSFSSFCLHCSYYTLAVIIFCYSINDRKDHINEMLEECGH